MLPWGRNDKSKVKLFLLHFPVCLNSFFFLIYWYANISPLESRTFTDTLFFVGDFLRVFSRGSWTEAERAWSQFMGHCRVHSQDQGLSVYYLTHGWARFPPGPMAYDAGTHNFYKNTFVCGWMPNYCCWRKVMTKEQLIQPWCWFHSILCPFNDLNATDYGWPPVWIDQIS